MNPAPFNFSFSLKVLKLEEIDIGIMPNPSFLIRCGMNTEEGAG